MSSGTALLLVDVQSDFVARIRTARQRDRLIAEIARLLDLARERGWTIVHTRTMASPDGSDWMPHRRREGLTDCISGSGGELPPSGLEERPGEPVLGKRFFSAFENPELAPLLEAEGVTRLVVAGVHTHACIRSTVTDAYALGLDVLIPREAVGSYDSEHGELALRWLDGRAARCVETAELAPSAAPPGAVSGSRWQLRNPADWNEVIDEVPLAEREDVFAAAADAAAARRGWQGVTIAERAARLRSWKEILVRRRNEWVDCLARHIGKPRADAEAEIDYGLAILDHVCTTLSDEEEDAGRTVRYRPHGLVVLITPWNNPFAIPISKIAPALGYGNVVLWKPALPAAGLSCLLHESLDDAGLGSFARLVLGGAAAGQAAVDAPAVAAVSFTGSVDVGHRLAVRCGRLFRPFQAELGGNNAAIILSDCKIERVVEDLAGAMFSFAGQRCTAIRRIIVEEPIARRFAEALAAAVQGLRLGAPADPDTQMGPVISMDVRDGLLGRIDAAKRQGATVLTGGGVAAALPVGGCWMAPTVMTDLPESSPIVAEELFGPVVALTSARDLADAIRQHNGLDYGLVGAIYTDDPAAQERFLAEAEVGLVSINRARPPFSAAGPFAGWKESGYGCPEHGRWNRDFYTRVQAVYG